MNFIAALIVTIKLTQPDYADLQVKVNSCLDEIHFASYLEAYVIKVNDCQRSFTENLRIASCGVTEVAVCTVKNNKVKECYKRAIQRPCK